MICHLPFRAHLAVQAIETAWQQRVPRQVRWDFATRPKPQPCEFGYRSGPIPRSVTGKTRPITCLSCECPLSGLPVLLFRALCSLYFGLRIGPARQAGLEAIYKHVTDAVTHMRNHAVTLGLPGDLIDACSSHYTTKAGGLPVFPGDKTPIGVDKVACKYCRGSMQLIMQVCTCTAFYRAWLSVLTA